MDGMTRQITIGADPAHSGAVIIRHDPSLSFQRQLEFVDDYAKDRNAVLGRLAPGTYNLHGKDDRGLWVFTEAVDDQYT